MTTKKKPGTNTEGKKAALPAPAPDRKKGAELGTNAAVIDL